jgi:hypothetical protein
MYKSSDKEEKEQVDIKEYQPVLRSFSVLDYLQSVASHH